MVKSENSPERVKDWKPNEGEACFIYVGHRWNADEMKTAVVVKVTKGTTKVKTDAGFYYIFNNSTFTERGQGYGDKPRLVPGTKENESIWRRVNLMRDTVHNYSRVDTLSQSSLLTKLRGLDDERIEEINAACLKVQELMKDE